mgnify:CR=1 FL=1
MILSKYVYMDNNIVIIGAGISGLTVAHYLVRRGYNVSIYEKSNVVGGMARSVRDKNNVPTEHSWRGYGPHYHNFFRLAKEIPLSNNKNKSDFQSDFQSICCSATSIEQFDSSLPEYTIDEVEKHTTESDLWTYYKGYVYNFTHFIKNHPGGKVILQCGGKDLEKVWDDLGFGWHQGHTSVNTILQKYKIGKLVENMENSDSKTVFDNLSKSTLIFKLLKDTRSLNKDFVKLSNKDYIFLFILFSRVVFSDKRREKYYKMRLDPILKKSLSYGGYLYITEFLSGPGYGFDKNTMSLGHFGLFAYFSLREKEIGWKVMNKPTSEAWFDPWVENLKNKGVKFYFNSELKDIMFKNNKCIGVKINNEIVKSNAYCISINPFNLEKILENKKESRIEKVKLNNLYSLQNDLSRSNIVNNQISFRLGLSEKFNFGRKDFGFVLIDSRYNITFYNQADWWENDVDLGMNNQIKTLISGTLILTYKNGSIYNKPATSLTKEKLLEEIIQQFKSSIQFNNLLLENNQMNDHLEFYDKIIYKEIFEEWVETPQDDGSTRLVSKNLKWVNNIINEEYRLKNYYKNLSDNLFFSGSHVKTSINIWSMEGAVESGMTTANYILKYLGNNNLVNIHNHIVEKKYTILIVLDNLLNSFGLPSIIDVLLFAICYLIIRTIIHSIEKK